MVPKHLKEVKSLVAHLGDEMDQMHQASYEMLDPWIVLGGFIFSTTWILCGFSSIPHQNIMKPRIFLASTPKMHFMG